METAKQAKGFFARQTANMKMVYGLLFLLLVGLVIYLVFFRGKKVVLNYSSGYTDPTFSVTASSAFTKKVGDTVKFKAAKSAPEDVKKLDGEIKIIAITNKDKTLILDGWLGAEYQDKGLTGQVS